MNDADRIAHHLVIYSAGFVSGAALVAGVRDVEAPTMALTLLGLVLVWGLGIAVIKG